MPKKSQKPAGGGKGKGGNAKGKREAPRLPDLEVRSPGDAKGGGLFTATKETFAEGIIDPRPPAERSR